MHHPTDIVSYNTPEDFAAVCGCLVLCAVIVYLGRKFGK